jgi:hypothetical protein
MHGVIGAGAKCLPQKFDFMAGFLTERRASPLFGGGEKEPVHERARGNAAKAVFRCKKRTPAGFDNPVDDPAGMGQAQRRNCGQRVQNVAHGAQPDHKQAELGLRLQTLIFSQCGSRLRGLQQVEETIDGFALVLDLDAQVSGLERE